MYHIFGKNWDKTKYLVISGLIILSLLLITLSYKSDEKIVKKSEKIEYTIDNSDLITFKEFLLNQIKSPFFNQIYTIKKGDTIQKILKKYKVKNSDIQTVINQYKKYGNSNQLLAGTIIDIIIEKNPSKNKNSIIKFSVPITKSTTIAITRNEDNEIKSSAK